MPSAVLAEFESPEALVRAYDALLRDGFTRMTTFTPYPVKEIVTRLPGSLVPWIMLGAGAFGGTFGFILQWWCNARNFPLNVGGRPLTSIPTYIPITFESAVLASCLAGFFVLLGFCGMPRLSHPVHAVDGFDRASVDRFWIGVDATGPYYDDDLRRRLLDLGALRCELTGESARIG
jgi:hypothetical protein